MLDPALFETGVSAFATLFVIIDPIGLAPIFVALTAGATAAQRRRIGVGAVAVALAVLVVFGLGGRAVIETIGVGLPAFRIAGGIMLFIIALEMLFEKRSERKEKTAGEAGGLDPENDPTVFPLATPLLAGPGAMASMILLSAKAESVAAKAVVFGCLVAVLACCLALFMAAGVIERLLGRTGVKLVSRLFGVLLGALAVQFVLDGLADFGFVPGR